MPRATDGVFTVLPAMDSSTLNSSPMNSSAIGVGVAVLLGKDPAAQCLIFGVSDSMETFLTAAIVHKLACTSVYTSYSLCSAVHVNHCAGVAPARPQCSAFF